MERRHRIGQVQIPSDGIRLEGTLTVPKSAIGIVLFAHGSGSSRLSPRNTYVAEALQEAGIGTLLFDLLSEEEAADRENVFDIDFLGHRLVDATRWLRSQADYARYPLGYFGASTGAAAALVAAARDTSIRAVVSRGGRPDLAMRSLDRVKAPTLLIVGGNDSPVIEMNDEAFERLHCEKEMKIVPGATHLFEEPGTLEEVVRLARDWFARHLADEAADEVASNDCPNDDEDLIFADRSEAGRKLAARLQKYKDQNPVILGLPRGGVPVAYEVAKTLNAPLDVIIVRKLGAPGQSELGIGAVVDGDHPETILNREVMSALRVSRDYLEREIHNQLKEIHRRNQAYRSGRPRVELKDRCVIVVDDGIATGGSIRAALRGVRRQKPRKVVLAVPVGSSDTLESLRDEVDDVVCLTRPAMFFGIGEFYMDFHQLTDAEVISLLELAHPQRPSAQASH
jgi:predicted phosphoribosyltransferase/pimeloyl-ACP methyl ester carboxylesterase